MRLFPGSVRARLTAWYTTLLALPLMAFAIGSYLIFSNALHDRIDAFLEDAVSVWVSELEAERRILMELDGAIATTMEEVRFRDLDFVVTDAAGAVLAASPSASGRPRGGSGTDSGALVARAIERFGSGGWTETMRGPEGSYRLRARPVPVEDGTLGVAGVYPLSEVDATLSRIRWLFLITIPLLIAAAGVGGFFLARKSLAPVSSMATRAAEIEANTLHDRLPVEADDELGALAGVLNTLLDRLERAFAQQRRFMADASHELRTPTSIIRTESDVTLAREHRSETEYRESMGIVRDASRRLTRIVDDIFLLARADAGHLVAQSAPLYLDEVVSETVRTVRPIADERSVRVEVGASFEAPMIGDADLLGRLVLNLLDNAIKHSPADSTVRVELTEEGDSYVVSVVDEGPGMAPGTHEQIFERFFRVDTARSRAEDTLTSGAGLGLPICRRIAELHGGSVSLVSSRPGRTEFRAELPRESSVDG